MRSMAWGLTLGRGGRTRRHIARGYATCAAVGAAVAAASGSASGQALCEAASVPPSELEAFGTCVAAATGAAVAVGEGEATGVATCDAASTDAAGGSCAGVATCAAVGAAVAQGAGAAAGTGTGAAVGAAVATASGSATGTCVAAATSQLEEIEGQVAIVAPAGTFSAAGTLAIAGSVGMSAPAAIFSAAGEMEEAASPPGACSFTTATAATSLTLSVGSFSATNTPTHYMCTESDTPPSSGDAGWVASPGPTTFVRSGSASKYGPVYAWAKNAAGVSTAGTPTNVLSFLCNASAISLVAVVSTGNYRVDIEYNFSASGQLSDWTTHNATATINSGRLELRYSVDSSPGMWLTAYTMQVERLQCVMQYAADAYRQLWIYTKLASNWDWGWAANPGLGMRWLPYSGDDVQLIADGDNPGTWTRTQSQNEVDYTIQLEFAGTGTTFTNAGWGAACTHTATLDMAQGRVFIGGPGDATDWDYINLRGIVQVS
jgi:hypothetical protein